MGICGQGVLTGQGACAPTTLTTPIWYLDADNNVVSGEQVQTRTCNPDVSTVTYLNAAGGTIATPVIQRVDYTVTARQGELVALETAGNATLASILTSVDGLEALSASPYPPTLSPGATAYAGVVAVFAPANLAYFSLTLLSVVAGSEFSTNAGTTWLAASAGAITWGNNPRAPLNATNLRFRSTVADAAFQLIWEA